MDIRLYQGDLPALETPLMQKLVLAKALAIDTETQGLYVPANRLCLVQLTAGDGICHLVQLKRDDYEKSVHLKALLNNHKQLKIFHYARFDIYALSYWLGVDIQPIFCTKIAAKLVRTYAPKHGLSNLVQEFLGISLDKQNQSSDWAAEELTPMQLDYAAQDVLYLHRLHETLEAMLIREDRMGLAKACFDFLPYRIQLDGLGMEDKDIFSHHG